MVKTGLETFFKSGGAAGKLAGARVGLIVNPASINPSCIHAADVFAGRAADFGFRLTALFGPQHGIRGETQDNMIEWSGFTDPKLGIPAHSLYGETREPTVEMLSDADVLVFDVQDVGTRVYTFIWTMALAMRSCARLGKKFVILDRPNPIGGLEVEGAPLDSEFSSFVGLLPIPMRHGMTTAELALMFKSEFGIGCDLEIVKMEGWRREMTFEQTGLPWVLPSPNMPTPDTARVYPGGVIFEGTNVSEGRGTTRPFELVGAPWADARALADGLNARELPGTLFRECWFEPTFHKWAGKRCGGVQTHVIDAAAFRPLEAALCLLSDIRAQSPSEFAWKQPPYEYEHIRLPIDLIFGSDTVRKDIEAGRDPRDIAASWRPGEEYFRRLREKYFLY
ncbi:MAG TPA: DUF1343 domain-containing protein [bacterium]|nr:DUF1343 domain-containing protein [bacterium]